MMKMLFFRGVISLAFLAALTLNAVADVPFSLLVRTRNDIVYVTLDGTIPSVFAGAPGKYKKIEVALSDYKPFHSPGSYHLVIRFDPSGGLQIDNTGRFTRVSYAPAGSSLQVWPAGPGAAELLEPSPENLKLLGIDPLDPSKDRPRFKPKRSLKDIRIKAAGLGEGGLIYFQTEPLVTEQLSDVYFVGNLIGDIWQVRGSYDFNHSGSTSSHWKLEAPTLPPQYGSLLHLATDRWDLGGQVAGPSSRREHFNLPEVLDEQALANLGDFVRSKDVVSRIILLPDEWTCSRALEPNAQGSKKSE